MDEATRKYLESGRALVNGQIPTQSAPTGTTTSSPTLVPITSSQLTPSPTPSFVSPNYVPMTTYTDTTSVPGTTQMTEPEKQAQDLISQIQQLQTDTTSEATYRSEQEKTAEIAAKTQAVNDLSARLKAITAEGQAIPMQLQQNATGRGITAGGLRPIETAALRNNAIQSLTVGAQLEGARGNLTTALALVDRAVAQKYDPIRASIDANLKNLDLLIKSPAYSIAEKNRAEAQKAKQEAELRKLAIQEDTDKTIMSLATKASSYGAPQSVIDQINKATTSKEAISIASQYLVDPKAKLDLESMKIDMAYKQAQTAKTLKETALLGQKTPTQIEADRKASDKKEMDKIIEADKQSSVVQQIDSKLQLVDGLLKSQKMFGGFTSAVGPNPLARPQGSIAGYTGARTNFIAGVQQLVSQETIGALLSLKAAGGTLGALSDGERQMLQEAASKIGFWALEDPKTKKVTGYNANESDFRAELERIQQISKLAYDRATRKAIATDEDKALSEYVNDVELNTNAPTEVGAYY